MIKEVMGEHKGRVATLRVRLYGDVPFTVTNPIFVKEIIDFSNPYVVIIHRHVTHHLLSL